MQLKDLIKKEAKAKKLTAQLVMQNYMLERLLERISLSQYRSNFILKGGFLIAAIVGLDTRATMDLDTTIKGLALTEESLRAIFEEIGSIPVDDDVSFEIVSLTEIREGDVYPGLRVGLKAKYPPLDVPLSVDVTTDDKITPREVAYTFRLMFDDRTINILAYNLETVLAEKIETVLSRSIANTRPRDFYDIYILYTLRRGECNLSVLKEALANTTERRGSQHILQEHETILDAIQSSDTLQGFWNKYQQEFNYAQGIAFGDTLSCIREMIKGIYK
ncbi:nucleotidyl transferase AbiEii/AbiGii toxin family protein [Methylomusa anaerophila]|nr:nucleotidyl transferase AbiEii/AbiGii toxin family protein [Methylomusa anaerophila]